MKTLYPDATGIPCLTLAPDDPIVAALRFRIMRALYRAGYDIPVQDLWLGGYNGGMLAFAWQEATYGLLMIERKPEQDEWQVELLYPFDEPMPTPAREEPAAPTMQAPYPINATALSWFQCRAHEVLSQVGMDSRASMILLGPESHLIAAFSADRLLFLEVRFDEHEAYRILSMRECGTEKSGQPD